MTGTGPLPAGDLEQTMPEAARPLARGVGRDVAVTFGGRLALTATVLIFDVLIARVLGPEGKGAFLLLLVLSQLAALVMSLGMDRALAVYVARGIETARAAFANATLWTVVMGALGVMALVALYGPRAGNGAPAGPLAGVLPPLTNEQFFLGALALAGELAFAIGLLGLLGRQQVIAYNVLRLLRRAVLLVLIVPLAALGGFDLEMLLLFNLVALALSAAGIVWVARRAGVLSLRGDAALLARQVSFGSRTVVGALADRLHFRADAFLLNAIIGVGATGVYSVALGLAETLWYLPAALGLVLFSRAVRPTVDRSSLASAMTRFMLALAVLAAIPLAVLAPTLVELIYGAPFREAGFALQVMLPGVVAYSLVAILSHFIIAWGAPGTATAVSIAGLVVNLAANVVLIPAFGLIGAAAAATISYTFTALLTVLVFSRLSGCSLSETLILRRSDIGARLNDVRTIAGRLERFRA